MNKNHMFDAIVVGSGATGGWAAKQLTEGGMDVALVEAGKKTVATDFATADFTGVSQPPLPDTLHNQPIQAKCYACRAPRDEWFVDDFANPYIQSAPFDWIRMRVLGGRLLAWEGQSYRMSDLDFKSRSHDGYGDDWPISYEDLEPYYDETETYLKVSGICEGLPQLPDGKFESPIGTNVTYSSLREPVLSDFNRIVTPARIASMTSQQPISQAPTASDGMGHSLFASPWRALADAYATGRLTLFTDTIVRTVVLDGKKAAGVSYINRHSHQTCTLYGR